MSKKKKIGRSGSIFHKTILKKSELIFNVRIYGDINNFLDFLIKIE